MDAKFQSNLIFLQSRPSWKKTLKKINFLKGQIEQRLRDEEELKDFKDPKEREIARKRMEERREKERIQLAKEMGEFLPDLNADSPKQNEKRMLAAAPLNQGSRDTSVVDGDGGDRLKRRNALDDGKQPVICDTAWIRERFESRTMSFRVRVACLSLPCCANSHHAGSACFPVLHCSRRIRAILLWRTHRAIMPADALRPSYSFQGLRRRAAMSQDEASLLQEELHDSEVCFFCLPASFWLEGQMSSFHMAAVLYLLLLALPGPHGLCMRASCILICKSERTGRMTRARSRAKRS